MRALTILSVALSIVGSSYAQSNSTPEETKCKVRFAIYQLNPHVPGGMAPGMSKEQGRWFEKNKKNYPVVCEDGEKPAYFVLWSSRFSSGGTPESVISFGSLSGYSASGGVQASAYSVSSPVESEFVYVSIFRAADVEHAQQDKMFQPRPVFYTQHDSWWTYRKSHHKAMEEAVKFLADTLKK